jgi:predicted CXXCH cytochrome family protein
MQHQDGPRAHPADHDHAAPRMSRVRPGRSVVAAAGIVPAVILSWLMLAAAPAFADAGPHVKDANSGLATLAADSCAGCHRAHTAAGPLLLTAPSEEAMCLSCHGAEGLGATTNVEDGVQYAVGNDGEGGVPVAGALRSGGFVNARIGSATPTRISYPRIDGAQIVAGFSALVPVLPAGMPVTSAHLDLGQPGWNATGVAWGNGGINAPSPAVTMGCSSCHNPHGNGQYRILRPMPAPPTAAGSPGTFVQAAAPGAAVTELGEPTGAGAAGVRNYTVQPGRTLQDVLDAAAIPDAEGATAGDSWRRYLPWDGVPTWTGTNIAPATGVSGDRPEYLAGGTNLTQWRTQMSLWCATCHTRYFAPNNAFEVPSGDDVHAYRHGTVRTECTQCHVAHGSNAGMEGPNSGAFPYPDGSSSPSSRLLKVDNRGTCQLCHDPTGTVPFTGQIDSPDGP